MQIEVLSSVLEGHICDLNKKFFLNFQNKLLVYQGLFHIFI